MARDPQFPNRPDHPFFWEMSLAVIDNDTVVDGGAEFEAVLEALGIDPESIAYMATQRSARAGGLTAASAAWVDGFSAAMRLVHNRAVKEGQHRG